nr:hypothetical protein B0A51_11212 [Rachicladosporium sp. CCFEE 5018]
MEKFAELGGFANLNSAQANYHGIWKKVMEGSAGATGEGGEGEKGEKATPKKRGRKVTKENDDDEETPAKKTKAIPKRGKKVPKANEDGDGEEDVKVKNEDGAGEEDEET